MKFEKSQKVGLPKPEPSPEPPKHPDDVEMERAGKERALREAPAFCARFDASALLLAMVSTYNDGDSQEIWDALRESFWAEIDVREYKALKPFLKTKDAL